MPMDERIIRLLEDQNKFQKKQLLLAEQRERMQMEQIKKLTGQNGQLIARVEDLTQSVQSLKQALQDVNLLMEKLTGKKHALEKLVFKKSEKVSIRKSPEPLEKKSGTEIAEDKYSAAKERGNNGAKRKEYFPFDIQEHDLYPEIEGFDANLFKTIQIRDCIRYEYIPPRFIKHLYHQHFCRCNGSILAGKLPEVPFLNSNFDSSFIAGILQLCYIYSMPLERIIKLFQENGFDVSKSTVNGLVKKASTLLDAMNEVLKDTILKEDYINMDESYHTVLVDKAESSSDKGSRKGYFWGALAQRSHLIHFFYENGSRSRKVLTDYIPTDYKGAVQSDGLANYKILEKEAYPNALRLSCFQHCKRKFMIEGNKSAQKIIDIINTLYQREHEIPPESTGKEILEYRQKYAPPILKELKDALLDIKQRKSTLPKSELGKAVNYALNEYDSLCNYIKSPHYQLDNNSIERLMRYISLSRKNSLFCGSHAGAKRSALIYSLACSCRLNGINSFDYFNDLLKKMINVYPNTDKEYIRNLLPDRWGK